MFRQAFAPFVVSVLWACGCTHTIVPNAIPVEPERIPSFESTRTVTLANTIDSAKEQLIFQQGFHKWRGDLRSWTDVAIAVMRAELEKRGMKVTPDAEKRLNLQITGALGTEGFMHLRCTCYLLVMTGDGYAQTFEGTAGTAWTLQKAANAAVARAVGLALSNQRILSYLAP